MVDALYYNKFENFLTNIEFSLQEEAEFGRDEVVRICQMLKMAKLLSKENGKRYLTEFLTIPDEVTINGIVYQVTNIEKEAFEGCSNLKKVVIGKEVKSIEKRDTFDFDTHYLQTNRKKIV